MKLLHLNERFGIAGAHGSSRRKYPYRYDPSTDSSATISVAPQSYSGKRLLNCCCSAPMVRPEDRLCRRCKAVLTAAMRLIG